MLLTALALIAGGYQVFALLAALRFGLQKRPAVARTVSGVSILKPIRGLDPKLEEALASHAALHGEFEILAGVPDARDPALEVLRRFPQIRILETHTRAANGKVGTLIDLVREARYGTVIVSDADIDVEADYLERVTAPLQDPGVGLVTCLYRPEGDTFAARFEGLGITTDFAPSTLVARMVGVDEFAMGSTLAFRKTDLERIGGFEAIAEYLADDYQLGHRIHELGLRCVLSDVVVGTHLGGSWGEVWRHQVRWARTIRVSKFAGYLGLPVTFATVWAVVAGLAGRWDLLAMVLGTRMAMASVSGWAMGSRDVAKLWLLIPVRDLFGAAVWMAGLVGRTVLWRGLRLQLNREGRIAVVD